MWGALREPNVGGQDLGLSPVGKLRCKMTSQPSRERVWHSYVLPPRTFQTAVPGTGVGDRRHSRRVAMRRSSGHSPASVGTCAASCGLLSGDGPACLGPREGGRLLPAAQSCAGSLRMQQALAITCCDRHSRRCPGGMRRGADTDARRASQRTSKPHL